MGVARVPVARRGRSAGTRRRGRSRSPRRRSRPRSPGRTWTMWTTLGRDLDLGALVALEDVLGDERVEAEQPRRSSRPGLVDGSVRSIQTTVPARQRHRRDGSRGPSDSTGARGGQVDDPDRSAGGGAVRRDGRSMGRRARFAGGIVCTHRGIARLRLVGRATARRTAVGRARLGRPGRQHTRPSRPERERGGIAPGPSRPPRRGTARPGSAAASPAAHVSSAVDDQSVPERSVPRARPA